LISRATETSEALPHRPSSFILAMSLAAMLAMWSFNYVAAQTALRYFDGLTLAAFRIEIAGLILLPIYFLRRNRGKLTRRDVWTLSYLGWLLCANQLFFTVGLAYTTSGHSAMILAIGPILVLLLARAMKIEALTAAKIAGMALAFTGAAILAAENGFDLRRSPTLSGDLITLLGTTCFTFYVVLSKKVASRYDSLEMNAVNFFASAIVLLPLAIFLAVHLDWKSVPREGWMGLLYMAAISSVAAYTLFYWALRYMEASRVAAVNYFQPIGAILVAALFLGEVPTRHLLLGGVLILLGVYLAERAKSTAQKIGAVGN
jgi:drug/metabolite transporter (DMT)-like permease